MILVDQKELIRLAKAGELDCDSCHEPVHWEGIHISVDDRVLCGECS